MSDPYLNPRRDPSDPVEHVWVSPACPDCVCCTSALCYQAEKRGVSCGALSTQQPGYHDTTACPCPVAPAAISDRTAEILAQLNAPHCGGEAEIKALPEFGRIVRMASIGEVEAFELADGTPIEFVYGRVSDPWQVAS